MSGYLEMQLEHMAHGCAFDLGMHCDILSYPINKGFYILVCHGLEQSKVGVRSEACST
jgi:hypothetical protein